MSDERIPPEEEPGEDVEAPQEPETSLDESLASEDHVASIEEIREQTGRGALSQSDMTFSEVEEALKDEAHPRHAEAVEINRETAELLRPTLDALNASVRKSMMPGLNALKGWKPPILSPGVLEAMKPVLADRETLFQKMEPLALPRLPKELVEPPVAWAPTVDTEALEADAREAAEHRAERDARQDEQAELSLQALRSMAALLQEAQLEAQATRAEMEAVKQEISAGNTSATEDARGMLQVGVLTLVATLASIFISWVLSQHG